MVSGAEWGRDGPTGARECSYRDYNTYSTIRYRNVGTEFRSPP